MSWSDWDGPARTQHAYPHVRRRSEMHIRARYAHTPNHNTEKKHFCTTARPLYETYMSPSCRTTRSAPKRPIRGRATAARRPLCAHAAPARAGLRRQRIMGQGRGMQTCGEGLAGTHQWGINMEWIEGWEIGSAKANGGGRGRATARSNGMRAEHAPARLIAAHRTPRRKKVRSSNLRGACMGMRNVSAK